MYMIIIINIMGVFMDNLAARNTRQDLLEEESAAAALMAHLSGRPIVETSGDAAHRLNPTAISFKVGLSEKGDELEVAITQTDRHHPRLVHETIKSALSELDELKNHPTKPLQPEHDYNADNGKMVIRYDLPAGTADSIIHSLSKRAEAQGIAGDKPTNWVDKVEREEKRLPEQKEQSWVAGIVQFFTGSNSRA
jgi:hypothetical protein